MSFIDILNDPENLARFRQRFIEREYAKGLSEEEAIESWVRWFNLVKDNL